MILAVAVHNCSEDKTRTIIVKSTHTVSTWMYMPSAQQVHLTFVDKKTTSSFLQEHYIKSIEPYTYLRKNAWSSRVTNLKETM